MNELNGAVTQRVLYTLQKCVNLPKESLSPSNWNEPLTGYFFGGSMVDMVYFLLELESEFGIKIPSDVFDNYGFSSINKICKVIEMQL